MRRQVFNQPTAFDATNRSAPTIGFKRGRQTCSKRVGRVHPQVLGMVGVIDVFNEVEAFGSRTVFRVERQTAQESAAA
jgi:hypothetical protein